MTAMKRMILILKHPSLNNQQKTWHVKLELVHHFGYISINTPRFRMHIAAFKS